MVIMKCPKCGKDMVVKHRDTSHDARTKKEYDRILYWCEGDDIWIRLETPKNNTEIPEAI